ncbi:MAG: hypothetical protein GY943_37970 [Chloroflexi bacterium]|nr:hypothetical protein [Chloroflexota bacterium]
MADFRELSDVIDFIESNGWRWDVGMIAGDTYEARVWRWPEVIGRARFDKRIPVFNMLIDALIDAEAI